jgi:hypothetical protein
MKKTIAVILTVALVTIASQTEVMSKLPEYPDTINIENVSAQYSMAIRSSNEGLIESALFEAIKLQIFAPKRSFPELAKEADNVIRKTRTPELRYKAYVVAQFLHHPEWLYNMENINEVWQVSRFEEAGDKLFALLADELQNHYLVLAGSDEK